MASNMANLLMQYGAELPNIIKSNRKTANDLETEKLRQALLQGQITESQLGSAFKQKQIDAADIANQSAVEEEQRKRQAREAMASALGSYASSKRTTGMAQDIAGMEQAAGLTPLASEKGFDKPMSMREAAESAGLSQFADSPEIKAFYEQNVPDVARGGKVAANKFGQRRDFDTEDNRRITKEKLVRMKDKLGLSEDAYNVKMQNIDQGLAWDVDSFINERIEKELNIKNKVAEEESLRGARAATAYVKSQSELLAKADMIKKLGVKGTDPLGNKFTNEQTNDATNAIMMGQAVDKIDNLANNKFDESAIDSYILSSIGSKDGGRKVIDVMSELSNIKDPQVREYAQAKLSFVISYLRKTSGAAIGQDEYKAESNRFFARPNDPIEVLDQKRESRIGAYSAIRASAGNAYDNALSMFQEVNKEKPSPYTPKAPKTEPTSQTIKYIRDASGKLVRAK